VIYHVLTAAEWEENAGNPDYRPLSFPSDQFIHCCTAEQLQHVLQRYFPGQQDLVILCIDAEMVSPDQI